MAHELSLAGANAEALRRIRAAQISGAEWLDLGDLPIERLPEEIAELKELRLLALGREEPIVDGRSWEWEFQHTRNCPIKDLAPLSGLTALTNLDLSGCEELRSLEPLSSLTALTGLDLSGCAQLSSLEPLSGLTALTNLYLSQCVQLSSLAPLSRLTALTGLDLSGCGQFSSLEPLSGLTALTNLCLFWCSHLSSLEPLAGLTALTHLDLCSCDQLSSLAPLSGLTALTNLKLHGCARLTSLEPLSGLTALTHLNLWGCADLRSLEPLSGLTALATLDLFQCRCEAFEPICGLLPQLTDLHVYGSRFPDLHPSVCGRNPLDNALDSVRSYFAALGTDARPDAEIKVFVLGNGQSGKTCLLGRLKGLAFDQIPVGSTHGITIEPWPVPDDWKLPHPVTLRLWDFGGQDIYHGTHALFLREPAIYLLLYSHATENEKEDEEGGFTMQNRRLPYWFDYLRQEAGQEGVVSSPVLFLQSRCDEPPGRDRVAPFHPPEEQFPNLSPLAHISAKEEDGLDPLFPLLKRALKDLLRSHPQPPLPASWSRVRERLRQMQAAKQPRTMTLADLGVLCRECGCPGDESVLRDALALMGVVYYRQGVFDDRIIVDQSWALEAIYTLFRRNEEFQDEIEGKKGRFTRRQLERYFWKAAGHSLADQRTFLSFMEQCGICFRARPGSYSEYEGDYLILDRLERWGPNHERLFCRQLQDASGLEVTATFSLLHDGIARAFLSKIGSVAGDHATFWRYGCHFLEEDTAAEALIRCEGNTVRIQTWGEQGGALAGKLVKVLQSVPCGQAPEIASEDAADQPIIIGPEDREPRADRPENAIKVATDPKSVFFSYRHPNATEANSDRGRTLLRELRALLEADGWRVRFDEDELQDGDSISRFMDEVRACNFLVPVFCERYLESRYTLSELFSFREEFAHDAQAFADRTITVTYPESGIQNDLRQADYARRCRAMFDDHLSRAGEGTLPPQTYHEVYWLRSWAHRLSELLASLSDRLNTPCAQAVADRLNRTYDRLYPDRRAAETKARPDAASLIPRRNPVRGHRTSSS